MLRLDPCRPRFDNVKRTCGNIIKIDNNYPKWNVTSHSSRRRYDAVGCFLPPPPPQE